MIRRPLIACAVALTTALHGPASAAAISGLASTGPAVGAQYPDAEAQLPDQRRDVLAPRPAATLAALGAGEVAPDDGDRGVAALAGESRGAVERALDAVAGSAAGGAREYAGVPVLLVGAAVLVVASLIRLRRGATGGPAALG